MISLLMLPGRLGHCCLWEVLLGWCLPWALPAPVLGVGSAAGTREGTPALRQLPSSGRDGQCGCSSWGGKHTRQGLGAELLWEQGRLFCNLVTEGMIFQLAGWGGGRSGFPVACDLVTLPFASP